MKIGLAALLWLSVSVLVAIVVGAAIRFGSSDLPATTGSKRRVAPEQ